MELEIKMELEMGGDTLDRARSNLKRCITVNNTLVPALPCPAR
jgi:hypothetical protein